MRIRLKSLLPERNKHRIPPARTRMLKSRKGLSSHRTHPAQSVRYADSLAVSGEAFVLSLSVAGPRRNSKEKAASSLVGTKEHAERKVIEDSVALHLGKKYYVDAVRTTRSGISICVYGAEGQAVRSPLRNWGPGEAWASKVERFSEDIRRRARANLDNEGHHGATIDCTWSLGSGVRFTSGLLDPAAPEPVLREQLRQMRLRVRRMGLRTFIFSLMAAALAVAAMVLLLLGHPIWGSVSGSLATGFALVALQLKHWALTLQADTRESQTELDLRELLNIDEKRAHKLFELNGIELKRYYDQALQQRRVVFGIGVLCLVAGFASIAGALFVVFRAEGSTDQKIIAASLGAVSGILANFVAVIYLKMFTAIVTSMVEFHTRLVATHHAHFGNVLAARIADPVKRDAALAEIALSLGKISATATQPGTHNGLPAEEG